MILEGYGFLRALKKMNGLAREETLAIFWDKVLAENKFGMC